MSSLRLVGKESKAIEEKKKRIDWEEVGIIFFIVMEDCSAVFGVLGRI